MKLNSAAWLQISSGRCPAECQWVVAKLTHYIVNTCNKVNTDIEILQKIKGDEKQTYKSTLLRIEGEKTDDCINKFCGTILWHGQSPFRPRHKRKNWYVSVELLSNYSSQGSLEYPTEKIEKEISIETFKASGKGGQNVNKRDTAVRITHLPSGLSFVGREERNQLMNKKLALARLYQALARKERIQKQVNEKSLWQQHDSLERGNPVMRFKGVDFKPY